MIRIIPKSSVKSVERGRGIHANPTGRFEARSVAKVDDGWGVDPHDCKTRTEVRIEQPRKVITRNTSPDLSFDRSVNPYRGCEHGCVYCFARPSHAFLNLSPGLDFETKLIARPKTPEVLEKELSKAGYDPKPMAFGTNTDPYQPIEKDYRIMRGCLKVLRDFKHPVAITTKGTLIERDIDILSDMAAMGLARVGVTITTLDAKLSRAMEPRVPAPKRNLQMIAALAEAGIPVRVMISPIIPGLTDHELELIIKAAKEAGAQSATWAMLRLPREMSEIFVDWVRATLPDRAAKIMARVREVHGGRDYDPEFGKRMRGEGQYAEMIAKRFDIAAKRNGLDRRPPDLRTDLFKVPPKPGDQLSFF